MSETCVPDFTDLEELRSAMQAKANFENRDLYHRDGSYVLGEIEERLAEITGVKPGYALAYGSGMSAATDAIDIGMHVAGVTRPVIGCAQESYSQTKKYVDIFLNPYRAKVAYFDSGNTEHVEDILTRPQMDVVVAETVTNYQNMPVLDVEHMLETARQLDKPPVLVFDNTLPLSTGLELSALLTPEDKAIVMESGTKSYSFNEDTFGVAYTKNDELRDWLRRYRRTRGDLPGKFSQLAIADFLPASRAEFDARNKRLFKAAGDIALQLFDAGLGSDNEDYIVAHPSIATHPNAQLYQRQHPDGGAPIVYVSATYKSELSQHDVLDKLWASSDVREHATTGQSFGFDTARIIYDENLPMVRIAAGADTDGEAFGKACAEALYAIE